MGKEELIVSFQDTFEKSNNGSLKQRTARAVKSNRVYKEGFVSEVKRCNESASIDVYSGTTFDVAKRYRALGKVAVLNFANPETPGGGVQFGAMAQEECLCRSSNLFACISASNVFEEYYGYHRSVRSHFYTDRLIYTKEVTVFKDDNLVPQMLPENDWFEVDVITCAAPYIAKRKYTNTVALCSLFKNRIKNIFEAALDNNVDVLVLGAFGCGAFKNPPNIVARAFNEVIKENRYQDSFKQIVFAIKSTTNNAPWDACPNLVAFELEFYGISSELSKERMSGGTPVAYAYGDAVMPSGRIHKAGPEFLKYYEWKQNNPYLEKQFSILGDSISTLDGFNPKGYKIFYGEDNCNRTGVSEMSDTWWGKIIDFFGGELLVNNAWSGSRVTKLSGKEQLFPSGCSDERTSALHINDVRPDVILVYLGTNDWAFGVKTGHETRVLDEGNNEFFNEAYNSMLKKLKANYPESEIWCCTLCETYISERPDFKFPHKYAGTHIEEYNEIIRNITRRNNCRLIDLHDYKMAYDSIDGSHPTNTGMNTIATMIIRSMAEYEAGLFLDCENNQHEYKVAEEYTGGTRCVCSRCGKTIHKSNPPPAECPGNQHEYVMCNQTGSYDYYKCRKCGKIKQEYAGGEMIVKQENNITNETEYIMLDPNITTILYSDTLRFTIESSGETKEYNKTEVNVGRDASNDFHLSGKTYVARKQATFLYERQMWFLMDNNSTNGTYINGKRLIPGKKYQLATNDEISFAKQETVIFDKHMRPSHPTGDPEAKAVVFLEAGMATFAKSEYKDDAALKLIVAALTDAPLFLPVEIDLEAMLGNIDPTKLKAGDTLQPQKDVRMRILTLSPENGIETVPMFTSNEEANKGPSASMVRFYPQDYLPKLIEMDKPVIINPFSESRFLLSKQIITEILWPAVQSKVSVEIPKKTETNEEKVLKDNLIGEKVGDRYVVHKLLGQGGFFKTYLVMDENCNKQWAMKLCDKDHKSYTPVLREVILQESHMMMKLNHPAVPHIVDIIEDESSISIIREYIEGVPLDVILRNNGPVAEETVIAWAKQLCDVLGYLHRQNPPYIYRDLKPENVILQPCGNLKLIDFGAVKVYDAFRELDDCALGTIGYAAPEGYDGRTDPRSDIYSLGMSLHHLVTGVDPKVPPYNAKPIRDINPSLSASLEAIIVRCTQPNPEERFQNCDELMAALQGGPIHPPKKKGFLDKLFGGKSSKLKINETVQTIYNGMNKDYREKVFYGSLLSADCILSELTRNVFGNVNDMNINLCFQIYLQTWIRSRGGLNPTFSTPTYIKQALCNRFANIDPNVVLKCVTFSLSEIYRREPELKNRAEAMETVQKSVHENAQKNISIENVYLHDPEYGLVAEKPVFVDGFGRDKEYLSHLYTKDGTKLNFARVGSSEVNGIAGPVDLYRLLLPDNVEYLQVFVCNYGSTFKKIAPKGTRYVD